MSDKSCKIGRDLFTVSVFFHKCSANGKNKLKHCGQAAAVASEGARSVKEILLAKAMRPQENGIFIYCSEMHQGR